MQDLIADDLKLQNRIYYAIIEHPSWERCLTNMVRWEEEHPPEGPDDDYTGWAWPQVNTNPSIINAMIGLGFADPRYSSRSRKVYRLRSVEATKEALASLDIPGIEQEPLNIDDLFTDIVGHDRVKMLLTFALKADGPVHVLLVGPPGVAKTLMLRDIGALTGGQWYAGSTTTKAGLVSLLLTERPPYLVIDEIDKMSLMDTTPLLNLMETGMVTRLQHGRRDRVQMTTSVFAGANDVRRIEARSPALLSRFAVCNIPPYTKGQFIEVAGNVLMRRYNLGPETAKHVASEVVKHSTDLRDAVRVAKMSRGDPRLVFDVIKCLWGK